MIRGTMEITNLPVIVYNLNAPCELMEWIMSIGFNIECIARMVDVVKNCSGGHRIPSECFYHVKRHLLQQQLSKLQAATLNTSVPCRVKKMEEYVCIVIWQNHPLD